MPPAHTTHSLPYWAPETLVETVVSKSHEGLTSDLSMELLSPNCSLMLDLDLKPNYIYVMGILVMYVAPWAGGLALWYCDSRDVDNSIDSAHRHQPKGTTVLWRRYSK